MTHLVPVPTKADSADLPSPAAIALSQYDIILYIYDQIRFLPDLLRAKNINQAFRAAFLTALERWFTRYTSTIEFGFPKVNPTPTECKFAGFNHVVEADGTVTVTFRATGRVDAEADERIKDNGQADIDLHNHWFPIIQGTYQRLLLGYLFYKEYQKLPSSRDDAEEDVIIVEEGEDPGVSAVLGNDDGEDTVVMDEEGKLEVSAVVRNDSREQTGRVNESVDHGSDAGLDQQGVAKEEDPEFKELLETFRDDAMRLVRLLAPRTELKVGKSSSLLTSLRARIAELLKGRALTKADAGEPWPEQFQQCVEMFRMLYSELLHRWEPYATFPTKHILNGQLDLGRHQRRDGSNFSLYISDKPRKATQDILRFQLPFPKLGDTTTSRVVRTFHKSVGTRKTPSFEYSADWLATSEETVCVALEVKCKVDQWVRLFFGKRTEGEYKRLL
ncbi:hypothetical protein HDV00_004846 [Rhizophlyctis rosea]|nr:hypothetical protein HDV00_004846 [Rhizophlyctis rosea]